MKAVDMSIKWDIKDEGRRMTPPDEWRKIIGKKEEIPTLNFFKIK